jgi:hypothetical protein
MIPLTGSEIGEDLLLSQVPKENFLYFNGED